MLILVATVVGFVIAEVAVYSWHRWISHAGLLRWIGNDGFRRRHFHHHIEQYPPQLLHTNTAYVASCDVTFGLVEVILFATAAALVTVLPVTLVIASVTGIALHGWLAATAHRLCHASDLIARHLFLLRFNIGFRAFVQLRNFHDAHHRGRGNYSLMIPLLDVLGRTIIHQDDVASDLPNELFPGFQPELSSSCGESLFRAP
jgi:hypothetical protein